MIDSPFKQALANRVGKLETLDKKKREIIGCGAQSVVLANSHKEVYVVTRTVVAKSIELLKDLPERPTLFAVPKVVGINIELAGLISTEAPEKTKKEIRKIHDINPSQLWNRNIVYSLPRYDGTLEDLNTLRFSKDSVKTLRSTLQEALTFLHDNGLTHNDIALRNVFYKGQSPHLTFFLGDFGKVTKNDENSHGTKCAKDLMRLNLLIDKVYKTLEHKEEIRTKYAQQNKSYLLSRRMLSSRLNLPSPKISPVEQTTKQDLYRPPSRAARAI